MRVSFLTLAVLLVLALAGTLCAGETLYLSRILDLDFRYPGKITKISAEGNPPAAEEVFKNQYVLVLPPQIKLDLSIASNNEAEHHYHICVRVQDQRRPVEKVEAIILPDASIKNYWLASYRYQFTFMRKNATGQGQFVTAMVKLDVYGPGPK